MQVLTMNISLCLFLAGSRYQHPRPPPCSNGMMIMAKVRMINVLVWRWLQQHHQGDYGSHEGDYVKVKVIM